MENPVNAALYQALQAVFRSPAVGSDFAQAARALYDACTAPVEGTAPTEHIQRIEQARRAVDNLRDTPVEWRVAQTLYEVAQGVISVEYARAAHIARGAALAQTVLRACEALAAEQTLCCKGDFDEGRTPFRG